MVANGLGIATGIGMAALPSGVTQVLSVPVVAKSSYGFGANARNLWNAIWDDCPDSTGSLLGDAAQAIAPGNKQAQRAASAVDLGLDFASGQITKRVVSKLSGTSSAAFPSASYYPTDPTSVGNAASGFQAASIVDTISGNLSNSEDDCE